MPGVRYAGNPLSNLAHVPGTWKGRQVHYPITIVNPWDSDQVFLYHGGGGFISANYSIGIATADITDPTNWTNGSNPIITTPAGTGCIIGPDGVFYNSSTDEIWLFATIYASGFTSSWQGLFKSSDGYSFTYYGATISPSGDETMVGNSGYLEDGNDLYCYYTYRTEAATLPGIRLATFTNWKTSTPSFDKQGAVISTGSAGSYDSKYIEGCQVLKLGSTYVIFYSCFNGTDFTDGDWSSAFATSSSYNGTFTKEPTNPVFTKGPSGQWDGRYESCAHISQINANWYLFYQGAQAKNFQNYTVDYTTDTLTANSHGLLLNDMIQLSTTGTHPAGLNGGTSYFVANPAANTFKLSASENGSPINITGNGSGTLSFIDDPMGYNASLWDTGLVEIAERFVMSEMSSDTLMEGTTLIRTAGTFSLDEMSSDSIMEGLELVQASFSNIRKADGTQAGIRRKIDGTPAGVLRKFASGVWQ